MASLISAIGHNPVQRGMDLIKETTTQNFKADVIEASEKVPVLVDFWAPWCEPCKQLAPRLEKLVKKANGRIKLVKMNIDDHPEIATQLSVQSIPAVFAFDAGRPVDGFMGALSESQIQAFIDRNMREEEEDTHASMLQSAKSALGAGDIQSAMNIYLALQSEDPINIEVLAGLAKCYIEKGDLDQASILLDRAACENQSSPVLTSARAHLELALKKGQTSGDVKGYQDDLSRDPNDHQARFDLALTLNSQGDKARALEQLLEIIRRDPDWNDEMARKQLVQFFEAWGSLDKLTIEGRRSLASLMFV